MSSDGVTTLAPIGTVTPGPYTSGQSIQITGTANAVLDNANLVANSVPGQTTGNPTGSFYFEECTDPGGLAANLPTTSSGCEAATDDFTSVQKSSDGSFDDPSYIVYALPDPGTLGSATMVGTCDVAPNTCVIGIFAENPGTTGFNYPHLFSAPFNIEVGDGLDLGSQSRRRHRSDSDTHFGDELDRRSQPDHRNGRLGQHLPGHRLARGHQRSSGDLSQIRHVVAGIWPLHH